MIGLTGIKNKHQLLEDKRGDRFNAAVLDVSNRGAVKNGISEIFTENNCPEILINNAGAGMFGKIDEMPVEE